MRSGNTLKLVNLIITQQKMDKPKVTLVKISNTSLAQGFSTTTQKKGALLSVTLLAVLR